MSRLAPEVWARLIGDRPHGDTLWARRAAPEISERLVAALDAEGRRHLLVLLQNGEGELQDTQSRGVSVVTRELVVPGHEPGRYLDVTCLDSVGHEVFDLIGWEMAERLAAAQEKTPEIVARVLAKWRRFWGQPPRQLLSREEQLGLFAELWFLSVWLIPKVGTGEAVKRWRGPFGARHDFEWLGRSVEVKATTFARGLIHRIHGIEQLAPPDGGDLLFFSLRLFEEAGASNTLPQLVLLCRQQIEMDDDTLSHFEAGLARTGYSPVHEEDYAKFRLRVVEEGLFVVNERFPRVTPDSFQGGVPAGVERIEYEINLSGFTDLRVARNVDELSSI